MMRSNSRLFSASSFVRVRISTWIFSAPSGPFKSGLSRSAGNLTSQQDEGLLGALMITFAFRDDEVDLVIAEKHESTRKFVSEEVGLSRAVESALSVSTDRHAPRD